MKFRQPGDDPLSTLPPHLARLLLPVAQGLSNQEIADDLRLRRHTVENYVSEILELTGHESRSRLMAALYRQRDAWRLTPRDPEPDTENSL